ncbi:MAG: hypothetical protein K6T83_21865 [Alicyclobacillus sp.]|nr:hypothetical protein [Alicyclobacillus sp.]
MICKERLIDALTQTHRALLAYVECVDLCETEEERERLTEIATILAEQARRIQEKLLDHVPSKYQA